MSKSSKVRCWVTEAGSFLPLDEAIAYRAVTAIVSRSDGRVSNRRFEQVCYLWVFQLFTVELDSRVLGVIS